MPNFLIFDGSYFCFYRYYAIQQWFKLSKPDETLENPVENKDFIEKFEKTFIEKFQEIAGKLNIENPIVVVGKDCRRKDIWRNDLCDYYKANRVYEDDFLGGPFFQIGLEILKELNIKTLYHPRFEADDCIAITTKNSHFQILCVFSY